jgi:hypothetical protein
MSHNWYIGQDIVCIKSHSQGVVKEDEVFVIKGLRTAPCNCGNIEINIGIISNGEVLHECGSCGAVTTRYESSRFLSERIFAPLDTLTDISEIEEILSQPIETLFNV